jgi:hypothetical protein
MHDFCVQAFYRACVVLWFSASRLHIEHRHALPVAGRLPQLRLSNPTPIPFNRRHTTDYVR